MSWVKCWGSIKTGKSIDLALDFVLGLISNFLERNQIPRKCEYCTKNLGIWNNFLRFLIPFPGSILPSFLKTFTRLLRKGENVTQFLFKTWRVRSLPMPNKLGILLLLISLNYSLLPPITWVRSCLLSFLPKFSQTQMITSLSLSQIGFFLICLVCAFVYLHRWHSNFLRHIYYQFMIKQNYIMWIKVRLCIQYYICKWLSVYIMPNIWKKARTQTRFWAIIFFVRLHRQPVLSCLFLTFLES